MWAHLWEELPELCDSAYDLSLHVASQEEVWSRGGHLGHVRSRGQGVPGGGTDRAVMSPGPVGLRGERAGAGSAPEREEPHRHGGALEFHEVAEDGDLRRAGTVRRSSSDARSLIGREKLPRPAVQLLA